MIITVSRLGELLKALREHLIAELRRQERMTGLRIFLESNAVLNCVLLGVTLTLLCKGGGWGVVTEHSGLSKFCSLLEWDLVTEWSVTE